ncbi:MAG: flap endonuclease [Acidimicrobiia bacterium]|nr:flap endonuclease [Acidimicrobiia bacterium]
MQIHLMDGTYELFRSYFGAPKRKAPNGTEIGAVAGLLAGTLNLLMNDGVTHLAGAFDTKIESFRNDLFGGYKTGEGIDPELLAQFPLAEQAMKCLGVTVWSMLEYEADDAIATAAHRWRDEADRIVILSPDKDMAQCITGDLVVGYDRRRSAEINEAGVWDKFGVAPKSIPDYLALVGDSADGLPGVAGWGAKSSGVVLARYKHLEFIPLETRLWDVDVRGADRLVENLRKQMAPALFYRFLATLRLDVPIEETVADIEWQGALREPWEMLCDTLGLDRLKTRPNRWQ